jgi:hypothetical protein
MPRRAILPLITVVASLMLATAAQANWLNGVGRYLGVGWSDGYHSRTACPPKRPGGNCPNCDPEAPWWAKPATTAEPLPHPAGVSRAPASGPSLFRQPGTGSSVIISDQPAGGY